ncbi:MAG: biotin--[acetyl-CoA-carboxylase] ligase [Nitrospiraceae bacterium]|nr:biotin--[acetyl-CoA-carboxylase] ligase [Nitrospiraceae bacterium]
MTKSGNTIPAGRCGAIFADLSSDEILAGVCGFLWKKVCLFESVDSTNERALALASSEVPPHGTVIIADAQSSGRGRLGRKWFSPPGRNIYMSALLKPEIGLRDATLLTIVGALAGVVALRNKTGLDLRIKWPNDLMVNNKKIGGILTEIRSDPEKINLAVIGIGVNVNSEVVDFPEELSGIVTSARTEAGRMFSRVGIIIEILRELERWYKTLTNEGRRPLLEEWKSRSSTIGKKVRIVLGNEILSGVAETIDDNGMLILRTGSGGKRRISSGDVMELR